MDDLALPDPADSEVEQWIKQELGEAADSETRRIFKKIVLAAMGSVPWVGGFISALAAFRDEKGQLQVDELQRRWLEEHSEKMSRLGRTILDLVQRVKQLGDDIKERIESDEYLGLVRKAFRAWDRADTEEKRDTVRKLIGNAAATNICSDDVVRLFLDWIDSYHEIHFSVIREIYNNQGTTRSRIWRGIAGAQPREDSAEADLFKLMIRDLSTGGVIRQHKPTNEFGQFVKQPGRRKGSTSSTMKSAFDDSDPYELTELGRQFVHYTMSDVVPRIGTA